jgi:hypothetical protein
VFKSLLPLAVGGVITGGVLTAITLPNQVSPPAGVTHVIRPHQPVPNLNHNDVLHMYITGTNQDCLDMGGTPTEQAPDSLLCKGIDF